MKPTHSLTVSDIVKEILEQAPLADAGIVERRVGELVKAITRQRTCERLASSDVNKRLARISDAVRKLDRQIFDDDPHAHAARRVMAAEVGKAEFDELLKSLEAFASRQLFESVEFSPALQSCGSR